MYPPVIQYETRRRDVEAELLRRQRRVERRGALPARSRRRRLVARFA